MARGPERAGGGGGGRRGLGVRRRLPLAPDAAAPRRRPQVGICDFGWSRSLLHKLPDDAVSTARPAAGHCAPSWQMLLSVSFCAPLDTKSWM